MHLRNGKQKQKSRYGVLPESLFTGKQKCGQMEKYKTQMITLKSECPVNVEVY